MNDPLKLFIKDEPLTLAKLKDNRFRIIFCLSLEDQLVDHVLFDNMATAEIAQHSRTRSKVGWSPYPSGFRNVYQTFGNQAAAVDKTAWDWTMPDWIIRAYFELRFSHCSLLYQLMVLKRFNEVVGRACKVDFPSGLRGTQLFWGLMKSGWLLTIGMNSVAQSLQHDLAVYRCRIPNWLIWAIGDDVLMEKSTALYELALKTCGCIVKHCKVSREFAGMLYADDSIQPLYPDKHLANLSTVPVERLPEVADGLCAWYALAKDTSHLGCLPQYSRYSWRYLRLWANGIIG